MTKAKRILSVVLVTLLIINLFGDLKISAKTVVPKVPSVSVKAVKKNSAIKITIGKTKNADGYEIRCSCYDELYEGITCLDDMYPFTIDLKEDGSKKRSIIINSIIPGNQKISVRAYRIDDGKKVYSSFSKPQGVKVKKAKKGFETSYDFSEVEIGDVIKFGSYEQDNDFTNGKEPIEWIVISKDEKSIQVISLRILDFLTYNYPFVDKTWEECSLRKWLNNNFYNFAFNKNEQKMIKTTKVQAVNTFRYIDGYENGGNDTKDKLYIATEEEYWDISLLFTYIAQYIAYDPSNAEIISNRFQNEGEPTEYSVNIESWQNDTYGGGTSLIDIMCMWGRGPLYGVSLNRSTPDENGLFTYSSSYQHSALWGARGIRPLMTIKIK